ncbi:centromere protein K [Phascolarctos cinereus]|uniref:Centromere protein K n=1 Tax=Phascolarctos cinereus TaxID=38626 RepID=A0A6P5M363_PHACI|nr:centromere protein K [Phascolarctos cinereus]XP_020862948.1 centromere protein K [Phascolarctos cinereus]XP_020862949.1 centromere protein K [Phascolarctos cinereus]
MELNQQNPAPDNVQDKEYVVDKKDKIIEECEELWKQMEKCQQEIALAGGERLNRSNAQLTLLMMRLKSLTAECNQWQERTPDIIPLNPENLVALGKEELQKLDHDLEILLSTVQSKNQKLREDLRREQGWLDEQEELVASLNEICKELKNQVITASEKRILLELKTKMTKIRRHREKLLTSLGEVLDKHFPLPEENGNKKRKRECQPNVRLMTVHEILEILINSLLHSPHDPYVKINDSFWPPYIELLLRSGIALRHQDDPSRIRLEAFHQ